MPSKRDLYRRLCSESARNARHFLNDARKLKRGGSRGHAIALAVLSIEESAKARTYHEATEGILRVVCKNPNHMTTFQEKELLDHRFKHAVLANVLADYFRYAPFYEVIENLRKPSLSKDEVREIVVGAVHSYRLLQVDLASGGRAAREVQSIFGLLERLNELKNRGFYVDHASGQVLLPNDLSTRDLERLLELAEGTLEITTEIVHPSLRGARETAPDPREQGDAQPGSASKKEASQGQSSRRGRGRPSLTIGDPLVLDDHDGRKYTFQSCYDHSTPRLSVPEPRAGRP